MARDDAEWQYVDRPFDDDDEFEDVSIEALIEAPDRTSDEAKEPFDYATEKQRAKIDKARAENKMRTKFFRWASRVAAWMIAGNFAVFAGYLIIKVFNPDSIPDGVMYTWITATVVEILGIMAIIARHLFPGRKFNQGGRAVSYPKPM